MPASSPTISFPKKLLSMITDANGDGISWDSDGTSFSVTDRQKVVSLLPKYFKHKSWNSLTRQLNIYGFDPIKSKRKGLGTITTFRHALFTRDLQNPDLIKRVVNKHDKDHSNSHHSESDHSHLSNSSQCEKISRLEQEIRDLKALNQRLEYRLEDSEAKFNQLVESTNHSSYPSQTYHPRNHVDYFLPPPYHCKASYQAHPEDSPLALRPMRSDIEYENSELPPLRALFPTAF